MFNIREKILNYLKDPVIRKEIWKIAHEDGMSSDDGHGEVPESHGEDELQRLQNQILELQNENGRLTERVKGFQKDIENLKQENSILKEENSELSARRNSLLRKNEELQRLCESLSQEREELRKKIAEQENELNGYRQDVQEWQLLYDEYCGLPDGVRQSLSGIFKENGWLAFVANGAQEQNFLALWDYCRSEFNRGRLENRDVLLHLLTKLLDLMNRSQFTEPLYSIQTIEIGSPFNRDTMQKTTSSAVRGNVIDVLLPGLENTDDGTVCRQSLVVIG